LEVVAHVFVRIIEWQDAREPRREAVGVVASNWRAELALQPAQLLLQRLVAESFSH
jgi:hypothetical protein